MRVRHRRVLEGQGRPSRPGSPPTQPPPLRRNRDFVLLQTGQLVSTLGTSAAAIAYPLLTLSVTGSAAKAGVVGFAAILPQPILSLVAGVVADRWDRRLLMIASDAIRAATLLLLAGAIALDRIAFWQIVAAALVEGAAAVLYLAAQPGAIRAVVPIRQLPDAAGLQEARAAIARVVGPTLGGVLFGVGRALPFLADALSHLVSIAALGAMRARFQEPRQRERRHVRVELAEGFAFLWRHPFLRTTAFLYGLGNVTIPGVLLVIVVAGAEQGLSSAEIGALSALFGACTLLGALASPLFRRALSTRTILLLELWTALGSVAFVVRPDVVVLAFAILPQAVCLPVTDSVVKAFGIAITPDGLLGRVESVRRTIALGLAPIGPLLAGFLLDATSARATVAAFAAGSLALALWGTLSAAIRNAPSIRDLDVPAPAEADGTSGPRNG